MKTLNELLATARTKDKAKTAVLDLEIEHYNTRQMIELMQATKEILRGFKNKFIGKALRDQLHTLPDSLGYVYAIKDEYKATLNLRAKGVEYRQSWDDDNIAFYAVSVGGYKEDSIYCSIPWGKNPTTAEIVVEWIDGLNKRINALNDRVMLLQSNINNYPALIERKRTLQAEIKERQNEIDKMGGFFNELTKHL